MVRHTEKDTIGRLMVLQKASEKVRQGKADYIGQDKTKGRMSRYSL